MEERKFIFEKGHEDEWRLLKAKYNKKWKQKWLNFGFGTDLNELSIVILMFRFATKYVNT